MNKLHLPIPLILLSACAAKAPSEALGPQEVTGVVRKAEVGVNCWQMIAADSTHYELRAGQVPDSLLVDGRQVTLRIKPRPDLVSTCMVGQIVDVVVD